jgi:hypothetical protein
MRTIISEQKQAELEEALEEMNAAEQELQDARHTVLEEAAQKKLVAAIQKTKAVVESVTSKKVEVQGHVKI